ncbi:MAG TPA: ABC transporter ATP-binding protein [Clostridiaceae bacterium]|nr:ABC transporter ATP-binding protein [Clostridiaceae bacterium]
MLKLFRFLKPYTAHIAGVLTLVFLQTLSDLYLPTLMADIIDKGVMLGDTGYIMKTGGFMLLVAGGGVLCAVIASYLSSKTSMGFGRIVREKVFNRVESFSLSEFDKIGTATLITRTTNDVTQVQMVVMTMMRMMVSAPMMAIGGVIMALSKDKTLTLVLVVAIPLLIAFIALVASKGLPLFKLVQVKIDRINLVLREKLTGIRVIRAFNRTEHERERFEAANVDLTENYIKINRIMAFMMPTLMFIMNVTSLAILWFGIIRIDLGQMEMGSLIAFIQYAMQIMFSTLMMTVMFIMVPRAQVAAARINEVLDTVPGIQDAAQPKSPDNKRRGFVEFRDVTFSYSGAEQPALSNISFTMKPGEVTAVIGSTGAGKSTLVNLIPRFYDVDSGSILVDGVDVREMPLETLRSKIGFVPQKTVLFSGTIADNIRFGKEDATDEEIRHVAEVAQALEFIESLNDGFNHEIAQGGTNVSGGQKQRISIARALVRKPEIYIFDDSFSALDFKTDARLRAALRKETRDSSVLIVAQRVGTVMDADQIIVLDKGRIVGKGTHKELLDNCEVYREIVSSQLSGEEIA